MCSINVLIFYFDFDSSSIDMNIDYLCQTVRLLIYMPLNHFFPCYVNESFSMKRRGESTRQLSQLSLEFTLVHNFFITNGPTLMKRKMGARSPQFENDRGCLSVFRLFC